MQKKTTTTTTELFNDQILRKAVTDRQMIKWTGGRTNMIQPNDETRKLFVAGFASTIFQKLFLKRAFLITDGVLLTLKNLMFFAQQS